MHKDKDGSRLFRYTTGEILSPGQYRFKFRLKANDFSEKDRLFGIAIETTEESDRDMAGFVSGDMFGAKNRYQDFGFNFYHKKEGPIHLKVLFTGKANIWLDYCDFIPVDPGQSSIESAHSDILQMGYSSGE